MNQDKHRSEALAADVRSPDSRGARIEDETPTVPSASGAFDHSPQFQPRVRNLDAKFVPTGRLNFVVARALARLKSHWFSRPCGTGVVDRTPPAVETAGYYQCVPAGRKSNPPRVEAFLKRRISGVRNLVRLLTSAATGSGWCFSSICVHLCPSVVKHHD